MPAVPCGSGIDIWRSCRFHWCFGEVSLHALPGGLGRFVPCAMGASHCRLRHIGWEKCGHGLTFLVVFVVLLMVMVIFFGECTFPPLVEIRESPEFHDLMREDKAHWPRCLLWHGWLPTLSGVNGASPWAVDATESAAYQVEVSLGRYSSNLVADWELPDDFDPVDAAASLTDHPDVWTDGSLILDRVTGVSSYGSGFFAHQDQRFWRGCRWGPVDGVHPDLDRVSCRGFSSVPGPLQTIQRAEMWGVVLALQTSRAVHLGVDNLGVVRHVDRLLRGSRGPKPFELVNDGDLLLLLECMLNRRGLDTVRISKVKGHADDAMVQHGQVRREDRLGNDAADEAADFGRRRVSPAVMMLVVICLGLVVAGTLLFLIFIVF